MFSFFKGGGGSPGDFTHIVAKSTVMVRDARHSFDLATLALLTDSDVTSVADDIRQTDTRINLAEQELRSELVVHVSVQGGADISSVMAFTLLLKKIERIGDQAKNILELAENGASLAGHADVEQLREERQIISEIFGEAAVLLGDADASDDAVEDFAARVISIVDDLRDRIDGFMASEQSAREVMPQAFYARYLLRIVANLLGVVRSSTEPVLRLDADVDPDETLD